MRSPRAATKTQRSQKFKNNSNNSKFFWKNIQTCVECLYPFTVPQPLSRWHELIDICEQMGRHFNVASNWRGCWWLCAWSCVPGAGWAGELEAATCSFWQRSKSCNCVNWLEHIALTRNQRPYFADFISLNLPVLPSPLQSSEFWATWTRKPCFSENYL